MGIYKPLPTYWVFCNKDTANLNLCSNNEDGTIKETLVPGIEGNLAELRVRLQKYKNPKIPPTLKIVFVINDGDANYNLQFGLNTLVAKWGCYAVLNGLLDPLRPFAFCVRKYPDSNTILPKWIQNGATIIIPKETRDGFPRKKSDTGDQVIDWEQVLGSNMEAIVPAVDDYLKQRLAAAHKIYEVSPDTDPALDDDAPF
jgi:hypothetical protein